MTKLTITSQQQSTYLWLPYYKHLSHKQKTILKVLTLLDFKDGKPANYGTTDFT